MVSLDVLALIGGLVYGYVNPGKEKKGELLRKGARIGVGIGVVFSLLNLLMGGGIIMAAATVPMALIAIVYLTVMFIAGTIAGDWLEVKFKG